MVVASDQGNVVSVDGGTAFGATGTTRRPASSIIWPPTTVFHIGFTGPAGFSTVAIASRSDYGVLSFRDWHPVGADERDYDVPDPEDADIVSAPVSAAVCRAGTRAPGRCRTLAVAAVELRPAPD